MISSLSISAIANDSLAITPTEQYSETNALENIVEEDIIAPPINDLTSDDSEFNITRNKDYDEYLINIDYKNNIISCINTSTNESLELFDAPFNAVSLNGDTSYIATNDSIVEVDRTGQNNILYNSIYPIEYIDAYNEMIYFYTNGKIYTMLPDGTDLKCMCESGPITMLRGISSQKVIWKNIVLKDTVVNYITFMQNDIAESLITTIHYYYDTAGNEIKEISHSEYNDYQYHYEVGKNTSNTTNTTTYTVNGTTLPLNSYPGDGTAYFNYTGPAKNNPDPSVAGDDACDHNSTATSRCRDYLGGNQCYGFANYVYYNIWGENLSVNSRFRLVIGDDNYTPLQGETIVNFPTNGTTESLRNIIMTIPNGSHIRVNAYKTDYSEQPERHSLILVSKNSDSFIVYDANANSTCQVLLYEVTYDEFDYKYVIYYTTPTATCTHLFGNPTSYTSEGHTAVCTECGHTDTQSHTLQMSSTANGHTEYCLYCNYVGTEAAHSPGWIISSTGHTQKCTEIGCGYTLGAAEAHSISYTNKDINYHTENCPTCGYSADVAHSDFSYVNKDSSSHYKKCGVCSNNITTSNHSYSYTSNGTGSHQKYCGTCGYVASTNAAHSFTYSNWTYPGNLASTCKTRTGTCGYCKQTISDSTAHPSYNYASNGSSTHTVSCSDNSCSYSYSQNHSITTGGWEDICTSGTCERRFIDCPKCDYGYYEYDYSHNYTYGGWTDIRTYSQCEKRYIYCNDCGYSYYEYDYTHNYSYTSWVPTTVGGYEEKRTGTCGDCGFTYTFYR